MERFFTTKIYEVTAYAGDARVVRCVDVQLTPFTEDLSVDELALYWRNCVKRCSVYQSGKYLIEVRLTRSFYVAFIEVVKSVKR